MPHRPVAVDISRLLTSLRFPRPSGVERLELGYARYLQPNAPGVLLTPIGPRIVSAAGRAKIAATARERWQEDDHDGVARELEPIVAFLHDRPPSSPPTARKLRLPASLLPHLLKAALRPPRSAIPPDAAYLHTSMFRLERDAYFAWLNARPDVRAAFTVYDVLPIDRPEFFRPGEHAKHERRVAAAARSGAQLITASQTVAARLQDHLLSRRLPTPPIRVLGLPVDDAFSEAVAPNEGLAACPYFVMCGTIEPRKNHQLMLDVWAHFARSLGRTAPRLIIAGRRGWRNEAVFAALDAKDQLAGLVFEAPHLSTAALARLLRNSRGLLSPSHDEGYGLPVAEALASGTPALIADTPVYRELWGADATLLRLDHREDWAAAILDRAFIPPGRQLNGGPARAMRWPDHIEQMERLLATS